MKINKTEKYDLIGLSRKQIEGLGLVLGRRKATPDPFNLSQVFDEIDKLDISGVHESFLLCENTSSYQTGKLIDPKEDK